MPTSTKTRKATPAGRKTRHTSPKVAVQVEAAPTPAADVVTMDAAPTPEAEPSDTPTGAGFKRNDLIDAVAARSELKRSDVRVLMELVLDEIGNALDREDEIALAPLGKLSVKKRKDAPNGNIIMTRIKRQKRDEKTGETPLADPDEGS